MPRGMPREINFSNNPEARSIFVTILRKTISTPEACKVALAVLVLLACLDIPSITTLKHGDYFKLSTVFATLTIGLGAMSLTYHTLLSDAEHERRYIIFESNNANTKITYGERCVLNWEKEGLEKGIGAFIKTTTILYGYFKLFFALTCVFAFYALLQKTNFSQIHNLLRLLLDWFCCF